MLPLQRRRQNRQQHANDGQDPVNYVRFLHLADTAGVAGHGGDWHLLSTSPCIDAGTVTVDLPQLDFEAHQRYQHNNPDFGVYESNIVAAHLNDYICDGQSYHHGENEYVEEGYYTILYPQPEYDSLLVNVGERPCAAGNGFRRAQPYP